MMSYTALYRRWRPRTFQDVVGQEPIITTLKNQIIHHRIAHAYLFSGTRGTGKTSTAKIFARAVNCSHPIEGNPCGECEVCKQIESAKVMDIIEIDAASNRGVDEIRELREKINYPPSIGQYKVYIIDEVHMLTQEAFNALLKTLEEPPKHVIFILATTEPHRLPATILSRCQRFDFKRVTIQDMVERMEYICKQMKISIEKKALELVAKNAEGALRDALSILDQCFSLVEGNNTITYEIIVDTLGLASEGWLYEISNSMLEQDVENTIKLLHEMMDNGKDMIQIVKQLIEHFRNILIAKTFPDPNEILELPQEQIQALKIQGENVPEQRLFRFINELNETENTMKYSSQPMIILEMECIKLCKQPKENALEDIIERLNLLEKKIQEGNFSTKPQTKEQKKTISSKPKPEKSSTSKPKDEKEISKDPISKETPKPLKKNDFLTLEQIQEKWETIMKEVKRKKVQVAALLKEGQPAEFHEGKLYIAFQDGFGFHQAALAKRENIELIEQIVSEITNSLVKVESVMIDQIPSYSKQLEEPKIDPVKVAIEIFGEDVVEVVDDEEQDS
ncbi:DNA polymerase-3 subunit gamma/tau [Garciella nitratireducens DSM 15102]|uniref:DNA-directed DNA polymerase n=2 Tax=Garciella TaxID=218204 RepID=A0A1T4NHU1_9FIRM|nr:DNA polymerase-3 subunit gamma/tau [Garciella nitratireducens DSM 15102]